jgi:hypothetical protein
VTPQRTDHGLDLWGLFAFLIPLAGYLLTLAPSVTFFDSGEFMTAVHSLGSAHSPGYPLYILYAKLFSFIPLGSIAFRVNLATAVSSAMACVGVYLLTRHLLETAGRPLTEKYGVLAPAASLAAALAAAFTPRLWLQSNHDKPYPLLACLSLAMLYLVLVWRQRLLGGEDRPAYLYLTVFLAALATGAHQTIVLLAPMFAWLIFCTDRTIFLRVRELALMAGFGLLGLAVQLYLPIRAQQNPLQNWGDARTLDNFLWHLLRKGYPSEKSPRDLALLWDQLNAFNLPGELSMVGLALLLVAAVACCRTLHYLFTGYGIGLVTFLAVIAGYFNTDADMIFLTEEFFTPLYLYACVFAGLGLHCLLLELADQLRRLEVRRQLIMTTLMLLLLFWPTRQFLFNLRANWQRDNFVAHDYAVNSLLSIPHGGLFFTWGDSGAFPLWYLQGVERYREDVTLLHIPHLAFAWYVGAFPGLFDGSTLLRLPPGELGSENLLQKAAEHLAGKGPLLVDYSTRYSLPLSNYTLVQRGICYQLAPGGAPPSAPVTGVWDSYSLRGVSWERPFRDLDTDKAVMIYAYASLEGGERLMTLGMKEQAMVELARTVALVPLLADQAARIEQGGELQ